MIKNIVNRRGFSVAEAMIALLIGSIALGMAAPMITKQIKQNNFADTERRILRQKIETAIPSGMVSFFNIPCNEIMPENSWRDVPDSYKGRYPRIAGTINVPKYISDPEGGSFSDDETKIIYQDAKTNDIYSVELKNNYVNIYQSNIANVSKLALINNNLYVLTRTKNAFRIFPYQEFVEEKTVNNAKVFGSSKTYYVKSAIWKTGPVAKNIKKQEQEEQKQKEIESMTNTQEGITIQLSPKPVDMIYQNGKIYVLSAALNSVDIFDIKSNLLEKTIPLKIGGFSTKLNPIKNSNMVIITNVMEKKYALFDLEQQKVLQINPIDVPISTITVVNQTEYETDKKRPSDTTEQIKEQSENL